MRRPFLAASAFAVTVAVVFPLYSSRARQEAPPRIMEYTERVPMSTGEVRQGDVCATFFPELESDEFFRGLQRTETDEGRTFRKYAQVVTTYPPRLQIQIDVRISICDADVYTPAPIPAFLKTLHFQVQWKKAIYLRRVANFSVESVPLSLDQSENRKLLVVQVHDSGSVPLTDHLILTILSPDGKILSRMAARP